MPCVLRLQALSSYHARPFFATLSAAPALFSCSPIPKTVVKSKQGKEATRALGLLAMGKERITKMKKNKKVKYVEPVIIEKPKGSGLVSFAAALTMVALVGLAVYALIVSGGEEEAEEA